MPWLFSAGMLEAEEVQEDMDEILDKLNTAGTNGWLFTKFTDEMGDVVIVQVPEIIKIKVNP